MMELENKLTSLILLSSGFWNSAGKHQFRNINSCSKVFFDELKASHNKFYVDGDIHPIVELTRRVLSEVGGELPYFSHVRVLSKVSYNYLIVHLGVSAPMYYDELLDCVSSISTFTDLCEDASAYVALYRVDGKSELCTVLRFVIHAPSETINNKLIPMIDGCSDRCKNVVVSVPTRDDPAFPFSHRGYEVVVPIFTKMSDVAIKYSLFNNFQKQVECFYCMTVLLSRFFDYDEIVLFIRFLRKYLEIVPYNLNINIRNVSSYEKIILDDYNRRYSSFVDAMKSASLNDENIKHSIDNVFQSFDRSIFEDLVKNQSPLKYCFDNSFVNGRFRFYSEFVCKLLDIIFLDDYGKEFFVYSFLRMIDEGLVVQFSSKK